jgi:copper(I)-binding protein
MTSNSFTAACSIRKQLSLALLAIAIPVVSAGAVHAHEFKAGALTIVHPWARATPPGAKTAAGYMTIENGGGESDRLVSVTAEIAGKTDIHEMQMENGVAHMQALENGLEVPAGGSVELKPGSYHLMLMDLVRPLKEGESFAGTLTFEKAGSVDVTYVIGPIGSADAPEHSQ